MDKESCRILDYFSILEKISNECSSPFSAEKLKKTMPVADKVIVRDLLCLTAEWRNISSDLNLTFDRLAPVDSIFDSAFEKARGISPLELYSLGQLTVMASETKKALAQHESKYPLTSQMISQMDCQSDLGKNINKAVDKDGSIKDTASHELARIRKQIASQSKLLSKRAKDVCEKYKDSLQENFITQRSERYVLAVKTEKQKSLGGLVHDVSESGATVFMEPFELVEENNRLQTLIRDEQWEIKRIIRALTEEVLEARDDLINIFDISCRLDSALAKARFSDKLEGVQPAEGPFKLAGARHPLLCILKGREAAVPLDMELPSGKKAVLISGPNAGGKTIALKTVGITVLLSYIGIHPPVSEETSIPFDLEVVCDGGDRQSIEEDISTFTARLKRWNMIWGVSNGKTLVLIDEIGSSTDPGKGAALAAAFIEALVGNGSTVVATTNIVQLKAAVEDMEKIVNASMDIDTPSFEPTYNLTMGLPGSSYTFEIARKYGFPEEITERALSLMPQEQLSYEITVEQLKKTLEKSLRNEEETEMELKAQKEKSEQLKMLEELLEREKDEFKRKAETEKAEIISQTRKKAEEIIKLLRETNASKTSIEEYRKAFVEKGSKKEKEKKNERDFAPGDKVFIRSLKSGGEIIKKEKDRYVVKTNKVKIVCQPDDLTYSEPEGELKSKERIVLARDREFKMSTDLRGLDSDTALEQLEIFIDDAVFAGHPFVTVIHGVGTGKLKKRIKEYLNANKISHRAGQPNEGGDGVTVLFFR